VCRPIMILAETACRAWAGRHLAHAGGRAQEDAPLVRGRDHGVQRQHLVARPKPGDRLHQVLQPHDLVPTLLTVTQSPQCAAACRRCLEHVIPSTADRRVSDCIILCCVLSNEVRTLCYILFRKGKRNDVDQ